MTEKDEPRVWPEGLVMEVVDALNEEGARFGIHSTGCILDAVDRIALAHGVALGAGAVLPKPEECFANMGHTASEVATCYVYMNWLRDVHGFKLAEDAP